MKVADEWKDPNSLKDTFTAAMKGPSRRKPNPAEIIDYKDISVGTEIPERVNIKG